MGATIRGECGTLIVFVITPDALYAAVDSRVLGETGSSVDCAEKLLLLDNRSLCALSGYVRFVRSVTHPCTLESVDTLFDLTMVVKDVASDLVMKSQGGDGRAFGQVLYRRILPIWSVLAGKLSSDFGSPSPNPRPLASFIHVTRAPSGNVRITRISFAHSLVSNRLEQYSSTLHFPRIEVVYDAEVSEPMFCLFGCKQREFRSILASPLDDSAVTALITRIFEESTQEPACAGRIGGPIDIASIDPSGCRFLCHKHKPRPAAVSRIPFKRLK